MCIRDRGISGSISFLSNPKYEPYLYTTEASAVIVDKSFEPKKAFKTTLIRVESSYTAFTQLLQQYERIIKGDKRGIEQPSYLGEGTELGENPYLGAVSYTHLDVYKRQGVNKRKIFNDPVYGFISIPSDLVFDLIQHPFFQRLRRIRQLGMAELVLSLIHI